MKRLLSVVILAGLVVTQAPACNWFEKLFGLCSENNPVGFVPQFETVYQISGLYGKLVINDTYYAKEDSAWTIARKFGGNRVHQVLDPTNPDGANFFKDGTPAFQRFVVFPVGAILKNETGDAIGQVKVEFQVNAGILADYYRRIPEQKFPPTDVVVGYPPVIQHRLSVAEQQVWSVLWGVASDAEKGAAETERKRLDKEKEKQEDSGAELRPRVF